MVPLRNQILKYGTPMRLKALSPHRGVNVVEVGGRATEDGESSFSGLRGLNQGRVPGFRGFGFWLEGCSVSGSGLLYGWLLRGIYIQVFMVSSWRSIRVLGSKVRSKYLPYAHTVHTD